MTFRFSLISWRFSQTEADQLVNELIDVFRELNVQAIVAHYKIEPSQPLEKFNFDETSNYIGFMAEFANFANSKWQSETNCVWDFSKVPFRRTSEKIKGLIKVFQSGGAYGPRFDEIKALELEERFRKEFHGSSDDLHIFCIAEYEFTDGPHKTSFSINMKTYDSLKKISNWFLQVAWDDLLFIINPKNKDLFVIALTDED